MEDEEIYLSLNQAASLELLKTKAGQNYRDSLNRFKEHVPDCEACRRMVREMARVGDKILKHGLGEGEDEEASSESETED